MSDYVLIRTRRRTVGLRVLPDGTLEVRAPQSLPRAEIERMIAAQEKWIARHREHMRQHGENYPEPTEQERAACIKKAAELLPPLVARYAAQMGVQPAGLTITGARTRFGSCSERGRLSFSWRLLRYPPEAVEAVVVHELAHLRHMNHQKEFYALVEAVLPDYRARAKLLKD